MDLCATMYDKVTKSKPEIGHISKSSPTLLLKDCQDRFPKMIPLGYDSYFC